MADKKVSDLPSLNGADVDPADLLYIVDSSAGAAGSKKITVGQYQLAPVSGGTANTVVYLNGSKVESSSSALTFDGTNLGIGTSSPGEKLAVSQGNIYALRTGGAKLRLADQNNEVSVESSPTGVVSNMIFKTTATTQMTLDSSGNLGIGTSSPGVKLEVAGDARLTGANPSLSAVPTSTGFYIDNRGVGKSTIFRVSSASAIDTTAATIDSSGNLGLGVTPSAWSLGKAIEVNNVGNALWGAAASEIDVSQNAYYNSGWKYAASSFATRYEQNTGVHRWFSAPSGTAGNAISFTQAMTLDASGNLGVGAVSPGNRFYVNGPQASPQIRATDGNVDIYVAYSSGTGASAVSYFGTNSNHPQVFITNNTERARITSGGDLLVGTATTPSSSNAGFVVTKDADGTYLRNACTITTSRTHFEFVNGNGTVGTISTNASATAYNTSSDRRLKEGIAPAADAGPIIDAIEVVQHDWKVGGHTRFGVIAQDLNAVAPEAVSAGDDGDEIKKTWGVDYSKLVPMLIKEIQSLRARVAALEAK